MSLLAWALIAAAALVGVSNLLFSAASMACFRLRERRWPERLPIGIPLLSLALVALAWTQTVDGLPVAAYAIALLDVGGPVGWIAAWVWRRAQGRAVIGLPVRRPTWIAPPQRG